MNQIKLASAAALLAAVSMPGVAEARSQMRAVGSSTVYPFAKAVAERVARANPKLGTPIIESTGTGASGCRSRSADPPAWAVTIMSWGRHSRVALTS